MARGSAKMGLKRCCGSLEPFVAILDEFQQRCAFGGNFRNPNIGVFQQNRPKADLDHHRKCCGAASPERSLDMGCSILIDRTSVCGQNGLSLRPPQWLIPVCRDVRHVAQNENVKRHDFSFNLDRRCLIANHRATVLDNLQPVFRLRLPS